MAILRREADLDEATLAQHLLTRGLVSPDQLQAMARLRQGGDRRSLASLVVEAGLLTPEQLRLLEAPSSASGRLAPTRGDPSRSGLTRPSGGDPRLPSTAASHAGSASGRLGASVRMRLETGQTLSLLPGVEVTTERVLGQGGMGTVYLVRDPALGRQAALKLMNQGGNPRRALRFRREAQVTARLDHPGIPPVFLTGTTSEGQDFLLMRYVAGRSLAEALADDRGRPELNELLDDLVKIGEAVAFAHSKNVVHRDLKPANVMVGAFGEVLVMDWGLARDREQSVGEDEQVRLEMLGSSHQTAAPGGAHLTQDGAVLGTPGYLAPEQARGEDVDERADVWALGSILVEILTGKPAAEDGGAMEVVARTGAGQFVRPRDRDRSVAPELDAIAARALAPDRTRRYQSVQQFTRDLKAFLEGRPVSVYRYGRLAQTLRLIRRHPAVFVGLGVAFVLGLVSIGAVARARASAVEEERRQASGSAAAAAEEAWQAAAAATDSPEQRVALGLAALQAAQRWRALAGGERAADEALFRAAMALGETSREAEHYALAMEAFRQAGATGVDPAAASAASEQVAKARDAVLERIRREVGDLLGSAELGELNDFESFQEAVFRAVGQNHPLTLELVLARLDEVAEQLAAAERRVYLEAIEPTAEERAAGELALAGVAEALQARQRLGLAGMLPREQERLLDQAERRLERRLLRDPSTSLRSAMQRIGLLQREVVGENQLQAARLAAAVAGRLGLRREQAARALGRYLAAECDGQRAIAAGSALCHLGTPLAYRLALAARDRFRDSPLRTELDRLLTRFRDDVPLEGDPLQVRLDRGRARALRGDHKGAVEDFSAALELAPDLAEAWNDRAQSRADLGDTAGALADYARAIELEPDRVAPWANRATLLGEKGDVAGALADFSKALELSPRDGRILSNRALLRQRSGDLKGALEDLDRALELEPDFAFAWLNRAVVHQDLGDLQAALADASRSVELNASDGRFFLNRGGILRALGDLPAALADLDRAFELTPKLYMISRARGRVRFELGDVKGGLADLQRACQLAPEEPFCWVDLAELQRRAGGLAESLAAARRAIDLTPDRPWGWVESGRTRLAEGDAAAALRDLDRAVGLGRRSADAHAARAQARLAGGDPAGAREDLDRALALDPQDADHWLGRARLRRETEGPGPAAEDLNRALTLAPRRLDVLLERAGWREAGGDLAGAEEDLSRAVELQPRALAPRLARGRVRLRRERVEAARQDLDLAVQLDPGSAAAWAARAGVRAAQGDAAGAAEDAERALAGEPGLPAALLVRAGLREAAGDRAGARADWEAILAREPPPPEAAAARAGLARIGGASGRGR